MIPHSPATRSATTADQVNEYTTTTNPFPFTQSQGLSSAATKAGKQIPLPASKGQQFASHPFCTKEFTITNSISIIITMHELMIR
jgi:purine-nucleoside phosphorylase